MGGAGAATTTHNGGTRLEPIRNMGGVLIGIQIRTERQQTI